MANEEHLARLTQGVETWNTWREKNPEVQPDLSRAALNDTALSHANFTGANLFRINLNGAHLSRTSFSQSNLGEANLSGAHLRLTSFRCTDLSGADLTGANLSRANLRQANLSGADLKDAYLSGANLNDANLTNADLTRANLYEVSCRGAKLSGAKLLWANLTGVDFRKADLRGANVRGVSLINADFREVDLTEADLQYVHLVDTNLERACLMNCSVYGISAWNLELSGTNQSNLTITRLDEPTITVDGLEVAQFIYLLLNNQKIRAVIDTITSKVVLILGRFTPERKAILDEVREKLRQHNYLPILFDFEKPTNRDLTEMISTLAHMARFIIADITDAKSIPQEFQRIVPDLPSVPVQPILQTSASEYGMFEHFKRYPWVLEVYQYQSLEDVIATLTEKVIAPAELKAKELLGFMRR
jgi:uncharacterized protein YjbI with pentapeptide repeats